MHPVSMQKGAFVFYPHTMTMIFDQGDVPVSELTIVVTTPRSTSIVATGNDARSFLHVSNAQALLHFPLAGGRIEDQAIALEYFRSMMRKHGGKRKFFERRSLVIAGESSLTQLDRSLIKDTIYRLGVSSCQVIPMVYAGALGAGVSTGSVTPTCSLMIEEDATELLLQSAGIPLRIHRLSDTICSLEQRLHLDASRAASAVSVSGLEVLAAFLSPNEGSREVRELLRLDWVIERCTAFFQSLTTEIRDVLAMEDPWVVQPVVEQGIVMTGVGATIPGCAQMISRSLRLPCYSAPSARDVIAMGACRFHDVAVDEHLIWSYKNNYEM